MTPAPLAAYAMDVRRSRGRRYPEPQHPYRGDYARDRDRVIHSRAFRRLEAKTQVFTTRYSDHFRNRLTHTIEVAQVSRTVANVLGLDEDLVEALALVHDQAPCVPLAHTSPPISFNVKVKGYVPHPDSAELFQDMWIAQ